MLYVNYQDWLVLQFTILLATISLSAIGLVVVNLTRSLPKGGILLVIVLLPLYIPILVLGVQTTTLQFDGAIINGQLALLSASAIFCLSVAPFIISLIVRDGVA